MINRVPSSNIQPLNFLKTKQQIFKKLHQTQLVTFDYSEFLCGACKLRENYLNKLKKDSFIKETDITKGLF